MVVVFMTENHRVHRGKSLGPEYPRWMDAVFKGVHGTELLAQQRIDEDARTSRPHHPTLVAEEGRTKCTHEEGALPP